MNCPNHEEADGQGRAQDLVGQSRAKRQRALGRAGEHLAAAALRRRGYRICERNFRCRAGEIDLIACEGEELVFIEVKTRRGTGWGPPEEALTPRKRRKLIEVASHYLELHGAYERPWRIDVVAIQLSSTGRLEALRIHRGAVEYEE
ncbi:YraN family protein [Thermogemmatispora sp.]|uniref:YraN family protein n=1 Tax=Thermogemmatispora sp. TaxID=1968838 RepID=UPI001D3F0552|nr:YraN family protein [Thermogemmatispora sp.]MBX5449278.1 YraN family protein [Thermogemmatispora sp.]